MDLSSLQPYRCPPSKIQLPGSSVFGGAGTDSVDLVIADCGSKALHFVTLSSEPEESATDTTDMLSSEHGESVTVTLSRDSKASETKPRAGAEWRVPSHRKQKLGYRPDCITLDRESSLILVTDKNQKRVHTYTPTGEDKSTIQLDKGVFKAPSCAIKQGDLTVVSDWGKRRVVWVDHQGEEQKAYRGKKENKLVSPWWLALDKDKGHIIVADCYGHKVQELDRDGNWMRTIMGEDDGVKHPQCLKLTESGILYVGYGWLVPRKIRVLDYLQLSSS